MFGANIIGVDCNMNTKADMFSVKLDNDNP